jgi:hypothetical protein
MKETTNSPQEQLDLITSILNDSREALKHTSFPYILWGGVCPIGTAASYFFGTTRLEKLILPLWIILAFGASLSVFLFYNKRKAHTAKYFSTRVYGALWGGISFFGLGLWLASMLFKTGFTLQEGMAILSVLIGLGYLVSSVLTNYRSLLVLGILWGIGGMACLGVSGYFAPALVGSMAFFFEFIPGLIMLRSENKNGAGREV